MSFYTLLINHSPRTYEFNLNTFFNRLTRSSSSSDYEFASAITSSKAKSRSNKPNSKKGVKSNGLNHNRLSRRSSAELLRKNHPYSSSSDDDSDSGLVNDKEMEPAPQLPPRRSHANKTQRYAAPRQMDGTPHGQKSLEEVRHSSPHDSFGINPHEVCPDEGNDLITLHVAGVASCMRLTQVHLTLVFSVVKLLLIWSFLIFLTFRRVDAVIPILLWLCN